MNISTRNYNLVNDADELFKKVDQWSVWQDILGFYVREGERFCNPLRRDRHAGCWLYQHGDVILLSDFANRTFHGMNIIQAIRYKHNYSYQKALLHAINVQNNPVKKVNFKKNKNNFDFIIKYQRRNWNSLDREFWSQYGISRQQLDNDGVIALQWFKINSRQRPDILTRYTFPHSYAYFINNRIKIYNPYHEMKWLSTQTEYDVGGTSPEQDTLIVTKSYKDYAVLTNLGYFSRFILAEGINLPEHFIKYTEQFDTYYLMDNDDTGRAAIERFGKGFTVPEYSDPAEFVKERSYEELDQFIKSKLSSGKYEIRQTYEYKKTLNL